MHIMLFGMRRAHGKSREHMAQLLNVHRETYARKERGEIEFTMEEAQLISKDFGEPMTKVFPEYFEGN